MLCCVVKTAWEQTLPVNRSELCSNSKNLSVRILLELECRLFRLPVFVPMRSMFIASYPLKGLCCKNGLRTNNPHQLPFVMPQFQKFERAYSIWPKMLPFSTLWICPFLIMFIASYSFKVPLAVLKERHSPSLDWPVVWWIYGPAPQYY